VEPSFPRIEDPSRLPPLADRYELIEPIARGGVAWVWRAHDRTLDRPVAVKLLRADADPTFASRFAQEAQTAARIRHPGVVAIYDAGVHDGLPFLAMELLEGETLRAQLRRVGKLDAATVRRLGRSLASALDAIRRAGLVHGDLKPENVIIGADGEPTIMDLGLARAVWERGADHEDAIYGTPGYLAPERHQGAGDHRSDIYALGALLFEAATGQAPPSEGSPQWASLIDPSIPEELSAAIARATLPDPEERYPTAAAFGMQLAGDAIASGTDTQAIDTADRETVMLKPPPPLAPRTARAHRRRRWIITALVALLAVVGAFLLLGPAARATVPAVEGVPQQRAENLIRDAKLEPSVELVYDSVVAAGLVITQDPPDGARIREGDTVTLQVSLGPRLVRIPSVEGLSPAAATQELTDVGFTTIDRQRVFDATIDAGLVIGTEPDGEFAEAEEPITLLISKGPDLVAIPSVEGETKDDAVAILRGEGFVVDLVREESRDVEEGLAIRTEPGAGEEAARGSTITLVVSKGPPLVDVPDLQCMSKGQAKDALKAAGLRAAFEGSGSRVVDQQPGPDARAPEGSTVTAFLGFGVFC